MSIFTKKILRKIYLKRCDLGYSQSYVGSKLGITQEAYGRIERGQTELTTDRVNEIAKVFEVTVIDLIF